MHFIGCLPSIAARYNMHFIGCLLYDNRLQRTVWNFADDCLLFAADDFVLDLHDCEVEFDLRLSISSRQIGAYDVGQYLTGLLQKPLFLLFVLRSIFLILEQMTLYPSQLECSLQNIYDTYSFTIQTDDQQIMPRQTCCYGRIFVVLPLDNNGLSHAKDLRILRIHLLLFLQRARTYPCARYEKWLSDSF